MTYYRRSNTRTAPRPARWMDLRYPGRCAQCGTALAAGTNAFYDPADRTVCCSSIQCAESHGVTEEKWIGSPVSGGYVTVLSPHRMRRNTPPPFAPDPFARTRSRGYYGRDAGRCEDAPCCGCCS